MRGQAVCRGPALTPLQRRPGHPGGGTGVGTEGGTGGAPSPGLSVDLASLTALGDGPVTCGDI